MLIINNLKKSYEGVKAVNDVSFSVDKGDIYGFLGPNGAGKTTTIRMIMGIIHPDSGAIARVNRNTDFRKKAGAALWSVWIAVLGVIGKLIFWN